MMNKLKKLWGKLTKPSDALPEEMKRQLDEAVEEVIGALLKIVENDDAE